MDHNKTDTLHLVWAVTSEETKLKPKFFSWVLGVTHWCGSRHNLRSRRRLSLILQCTQLLHIFQKFAYWNSLAWLQWWLEVSSKPQSPICDILNLLRMHSVIFLKGPSLTFLMNNFTIFQGKKPLDFSWKMSEHSCWRFLFNTWAISLRVQKYGFVLL